MMQRFTRLEDLADLEQLASPAQASTSGSTNTPTRPDRTMNSGTNSNNSNIRHHNIAGNYNGSNSSSYTSRQTQQQRDRIRQYIDANTTFLNSADTEGSGYIPGHAAVSQSSSQSYLVNPHHPHSDEDPTHLSRTPIHYPSSLAEDENYSLPSSPSLGYYSHNSRPSSQNGFWVDQDVSSLNLIMPSSAMFTKSREPTADGDKLGFVKLMIAGKSRSWHSQLIQEMFKWEGIIANDFEDEFLQDNPPPPPPSAHNTVGGNQISHDNNNSSNNNSHLDQGSYSNQSNFQQVESSSLGQQQERYQEVAQIIVERYASSMVLPAWARAGLDEQDMQHEILIKNICFVDTPGYESFNNPIHAMDLVVSYLGLQFQTTNEFFSKSAVSNDSLGRFLANNNTGAHSHVDLCLYVIEGQLTDLDIVFMQRLQPWVNLLPVLIPKGASRDSMESTLVNINVMRTALIKQLRDHDIEVYGMDEGSTRATSVASPHSTELSQEEDLSPPPSLSFEGNLRNLEYFSPPFVFFVPEVVENTPQMGRVDVAVQQLDVTGDRELTRGFTSGPSLSQTSSWSDMDLLRKWIYVNNLAALRHQTTLKFLRWRRHRLSMTSSAMYSSQESDSFNLQQQQLSSSSIHQRYSSSDHSGSQGANMSPSATNNNSPTISDPLLQLRQKPLPSQLVSDLLSIDKTRISTKVAKLLETHSQAFERIMQERQMVWRLALEGIERERRIDFLVNELKRWAIESQTQPPLSVPSQRHDYRGNDNVCYEQDLYLGERNRSVGLRKDNGVDSYTFGDVTPIRGTSDSSGSPRGRSKNNSQTRKGSRSKLSSKSNNISRNNRRSDESTGHQQQEDDDDNDPLGLGVWMGQFFGAVGDGIVHVVVMVGMGSFATWVYTHFIEHRVTWIG